MKILWGVGIYAARIYCFFTTFEIKDMLKYAREIKNQKS